MTDTKSRIAAYAARVEEYMNMQLAAIKSRRGDLATDDVFAAMHHSLSAGGKRIRPALIYAFCEACGGTPELADAAACAMEMSHTASLIFDDLPSFDDDDLRRNQPSCHKAFGEATAILAGYGLICAPFEIIAGDKHLTAEQKAALVRLLAANEGVNGMVGGQLMDKHFEERESVTLEELQTMCLGKTGALIQASCEMGCICGGGTEEQIRAAGQYGRSVGLAFQIIDDILDVTSTEEQLGKPIGSDAEENKFTFVNLLGIEQAKQKAAEVSAHAHDQLGCFDDPSFLHALADMLLVRVQ
ncbi:MAG: polyprenyl synthetase family protein [Oscillospiraceae bacterium]|nr:polyprenyl synthetase family protein [Oscillospiraceae bacterium]